MPVRTLAGRDRLEAQLTLALLPVGVAMSAAATIGFVAVAALTVAAVATGRTQGGVLLLWCAFAAVVALRNLIGSLKALSALSWSGHLVSASWSAAVLLSYPGWWTA